jgi:hypothetical protein
MTIEVTQRDDGSFDISWDENDPTESVFNDWTESDFQNLISDYLKELKENGTDGEGKDLS